VGRFSSSTQLNTRSIGHKLLAELRSSRWDEFRAAVAFCRKSGADYLDGPLRRFTRRGGQVSLSIGNDEHGTSFEGVNQLLGAVGPAHEIWLVLDPEAVGGAHPSFHPKVYLFVAHDDQGQAERALAIIGSSNLTRGGLFVNHEASAIWEPDLNDSHDRREFNSLLKNLKAWHGPRLGMATRLDIRTLESLEASGDLPSEAQIRKTRSRLARPGRPRAHRRRSSKSTRPVPPRRPKTVGPPAVERPSRARSRRRPSRRPPRAPGATSRYHALHIDIAKANKTEIYLARAPLNDDPAFFGWPFRGRTKPKPGSAGGLPQPQRFAAVSLEVIDASGRTAHIKRRHSMKMWRYTQGASANDDFRLGVPADILRELPPRCILEMHRSQTGALDYKMRFLQPGSTDWRKARARTTTRLPNSRRRYGWT
jgi:HKD family nuclease